MKITVFGLTISSSWGNGHATPYRAIIRALTAWAIRSISLRKTFPITVRAAILIPAATAGSRCTRTGTQSATRRSPPLRTQTW